MSASQGGYRKKLIEVSMPLEAVNRESAREKSIRHGHPSTLHLWWARRPLATCRAVLFAQLVDDPSSHPDKFPTEALQDAERARLHALMERLVVWENSQDQTLLDDVKREIMASNDGRIPEILDPFAGGGSIPLEGQRLGLVSHASDLNPVSVLINKALIEIPPRFRGCSAMHPDAPPSMFGDYQKAVGLAEDVRRYGQWMRDEAFKRIGHLYPTVTGPDGTEHTVIAWIWARTVTSPNPANPIETPLVRSWWLSKKKGKEAWVKATVVNGKVKYEVQHNADGPTGDDDGTVNRKGALCIADGTVIDFKYIRDEGKANRLGAHLIAVVAEGSRGRVYLSPDHFQIKTASVSRPLDTPEALLPKQAISFRVQAYGFVKWADLFTNRQLVALETLSDLVAEVRDKVLADAAPWFDTNLENRCTNEREAREAMGHEFDEAEWRAQQTLPLHEGGNGAQAYADAIATYLALAISRLTDRCSSLCSWDSSRDSVRNVFARQAIPMVWDFAEPNPFSDSSGNFLGQVDWVGKVLETAPCIPQCHADQANASTRKYTGVAVSTDPPYYDNIGYSDLSDFFYVWLRRSLIDVWPNVVSTMLTPKQDELVANPYRHDGKDGASKFFVDGFNNVFSRIRESANTDLPMTIYYAYKQQDAGENGSSSTGWHTLLDGLIREQWQLTATWPVRSELTNRMLSQGTNALASSIVLACRPRPIDAPTTTRRDFTRALKQELPGALRALMQGSIAPVDLAQAAIGPGIAVFSRYSQVREADGSDMSVKTALTLINTVLDEVLGEQESDFDGDTRFAVKWYKHAGWNFDNPGIADQLARSSDTSIGALERGGIFEAKAGKARLLPPSLLAEQWDPDADDRVSVWEATVRLAAIMNDRGLDDAAPLLPKIQRKNIDLDAVRELGYLMYQESDKRHDTKDAQLFNGLVCAWPDLTAAARHHTGGQQTSLPLTNLGRTS